MADEIETPGWYRRRFERSRELSIGFDKLSREIILAKSHGRCIRLNAEEAALLRERLRDVLAAMSLCRTCGGRIDGNRCAECNTAG